jgi:hypothetical protein
MAELLINIQHKTAEGKVAYFSTSLADVGAKDFDREVKEGAEILLEDGFCTEVEDGHYVFVPPHAIYRADFELITEPVPDGGKTI